MVLAIYFLLHCTPIADKLTGNSGARRWIGITLFIEVIAGVLLGIGLAVTIFVLAKVRPHARTALSARQRVVHQSGGRGPPKVGLPEVEKGATYV